MLQRSKPSRASRRAGVPAKVAVEATATTDSPGSATAPAPALSSEATEPVAPSGTVAEPSAIRAELLAGAATVTPPGLAVAADIAPAGPDAEGTPPGTEEVAARPAPGTVLAAESSPPGSAPAEDPSLPGRAPAAETAPTGSGPADPELPATSPVGATPVPGLSNPQAAQRHRPMMMEIPMQQANKATETMMKAAEEAAEFGRGNVEALTKATQIYFAGVQDLGKQTFAVMQGLTDHAVESAKALSGVKSLQEAMQIQSSFARAAIEKSVSEGAKLGESALKLTEQTFAPLTARMSLAAEKITKVPAVA